MTIEEDIVTWSRSRPRWQQEMLRSLAQGNEPDQATIEKIADELIAGRQPQVVPLKATELPGTQATGDTVVLESIQDIKNVNRLLDAERLTFAGSGLTVIYGDNASGKSGFARLIKAVVGARHQEPVHPDVFSESSADGQHAMVSFDSGGTTFTSTWPKTINPELRNVHFYDEPCGDDYLGGETELTYRPSVLVMLDGLIRACDAVHSVLDQRLRDNQLAKGQLPTPPAGSAAESFLRDLSATRTSAAIDAAAALPSNADERLAELAQEEVRLQATNPAKERARIERLAGQAEAVAAHVRNLETALSAERLAEAKSAYASTGELRAAAAVASSQTFDDQPVAGVGTQTWRALWEAARDFSDAEAYCEHNFPHVAAGARCVLCQQELGAEAVDRFARFQSFMLDTTEQRAQEAERDLRDVVAAVRGVTPTPPNIATAMAEVKAVDGELADVTTSWLEGASSSRAGLLAYLTGESENEPTLVGPSPKQRLEELAGTLAARAESLDPAAFEQAASNVAAEKRDLMGRKALAEHRAAVEEEIKRLAARVAIQEARSATDTHGITRKATDLTRSHVTTLIRDQFTRESDRLHLERVTLSDRGGQKGKLRHRPALLGAKLPKPVDEVLSEGEQTALGLAGYFTEAHFDGTQSAMVLDDPVSSLDHIRRGNVARRLAQFAKARQVIVFTHDIIFVNELSRAAESEKVQLSERCIQRRGDGRPGLCVEQYPWKAKDVGSRLNDLEQELARIKHERSSWSRDQYEAACAEWGGMLSETWERMIRMEVVNPVVDAGTSEVRPKSFRLLARVTEDDDREFQESYGRCSLWARRHDKSAAVNYVAPEPDEMAKELETVHAWFKRVRKYRD